MKEFIEKVTRPCRKTTDFLLLAAFLSVVLINIKIPKKKNKA